MVLARSGGFISENLCIARSSDYLRNFGGSTGF